MREGFKTLVERCFQDNLKAHEELYNLFSSSFDNPWLLTTEERLYLAEQATSLAAINPFRSHVSTWTRSSL